MRPKPAPCRCQLQRRALRSHQFAGETNTDRLVYATLQPQSKTRKVDEGGTRSGKVQRRCCMNGWVAPLSRCYVDQCKLVRVPVQRQSGFPCRNTSGTLVPQVPPFGMRQDAMHNVVCQVSKRRHHMPKHSSYGS